MPQGEQSDSPPKPNPRKPTPAAQSIAPHSAQSWDVFLSYSTRDISAASQIAADLRSGGLTVWHDVSNVQAGERIREQISEGIRNSKAFVLLASRHSLSSRWVLNELDAAMLTEISSRQSLVIPILIGRVDESTLPTDLIGKRYIDLRHNFSKKYGLKREHIVQSVKLLAGSVDHPPIACGLFQTF